MFNNENDFKKLVGRLNIDAKPDPAHRENLRRKMLSVFRETRRHRQVGLPARHTLRTIITKSPITKLAAAAAIILAVLVGIHQFAGSRVAWADVLENIRNAKTLTFAVRVKEHEPAIMNVKVIDPHLSRFEFISEQMPSAPVLGGQTWIVDTGKAKALILDAVKNTAKLYPADNKATDIYNTFRSFRDRVGFSVEKVGRRQIGEKNAVGFKLKKEDGKHEIMVWADPKTKLPILMEETLENAQGQIMQHVVTDIVFDADLDRRLFSLEPPSGYKLEEVDYDPAVKRVIAGANMLRILKACRKYVNEHDGQWPDSLDELTEYGLDKEIFTNPRQPGLDIGYVYLRPQPHPSLDTIVLYEAYKVWNFGVNVGFADYHIQLIEEESDLRKRLAQQQESKLGKDTRDAEPSDILSPEPAATVPFLAGSGSVYNHFLFTRRDRTDGGKSINTPVLAKVTAEGFEFRDIDIKGKLSYRWGEGLLCVVGGTLYAKHGEGELSAVNPSTGQTQLLSSDDDESVYSILNVYGGHSYIYDDGRLYGQAGKDEDAMTLRVMDFRTGAYRDITTLDNELERTTLAISPDHKHLAYFAEDPNGQLLTVIDVDSGQIAQPIEPIEFRLPMISSLSGHGAPLVWLDAQTVLFVHTELVDPDPNAPGYERGIHKVAVADITTGEMEDIVPLPGQAEWTFVRLTQEYKQAGPRIWLSRDLGQFSIDVPARKLFEDDTIHGNYALADGYLFYGQDQLGPAERREVKVSPDAKRAIWTVDGKLFFHDEAGPNTLPVAEQATVTGELLWLKAEDLKAPAVAPQVPAGWIAFEDRPPELEEDDDDDDARRKRWRERKDVKDHLVLTVETDKDTYLLHEPIQVTLTVTSTSDGDIEVAKPLVFPKDAGGTTDVTLDYPGGSKGIDCGAVPYEPNEERIVLGPAESVSATDTLEVSLVGNYRIRCEYEGLEDRWRGHVEDEVTFKVKPVDSPDQEQRLLEAKFGRLMEKFRRELSIAPGWNGANDTVGDKIIGMTGMGPNVAPYLIEVIKNEQSDVARGLLYRPLEAVAGAECLPFFQSRLMQGAEDESGAVCGWLYDLYRKGQDGSAEALATLLSAMDHENAAVRRQVAEHLTKVYDPHVEACFEAAIEDENQEVRTRAARYLAAAEWLDLDQWLDVAADKPTPARYLAAHSIIEQLEKTWNITKGQLPDVTWEEASKNPKMLEQFRSVVCAWHEWASENLRFSSQFFEGDREHWVKEPPTENN